MAFPYHKLTRDASTAAPRIFLTRAGHSGNYGENTVNIALCTSPRDWKKFARNCRMLGAIQRRTWNIYKKSLVA